MCLPTGCVGVDLVSGAVGPTYYAKVKIEGTVVTSMVDPGSSATIISYEKFCEIGKQAGIPAGNLDRPDLVLRDYNQQAIPVGARVNLNFRWKDKTVTAPAYIRAERCRGEPCLLGTNVVISLGLMIPDPDLEVRGNGFRKERGVSVGVCLVGTVRVPGRSAVCVKGWSKGEIPRKT